MRLITFNFDLLDSLEDDKPFKQFCRLDATLQAIFLYAASFAYFNFRKELLITSIDRDLAGVHSYHRGIDFDVDEKGQYVGLSANEAAILCGYLNGKFSYDTSRPQFKVCIYGVLDPHDKHWNHVHLQVCHDNLTRVREGEQLYA
jgi:hypothetical protein